jgi:hypothetical protein
MEQEREAATQNQHLYSNPVIESILNLNRGTKFSTYSSLHGSISVYTDRHSVQYLLSRYSVLEYGRTDKFSSY